MHKNIYTEERQDIINFWTDADTDYCYVLSSSFKFE